MKFGDYCDDVERGELLIPVWGQFVKLSLNSLPVGIDLFSTKGIQRGVIYIDRFVLPYKSVVEIQHDISHHHHGLKFRQSRTLFFGFYHCRRSVKNRWSMCFFCFPYSVQMITYNCFLDSRPTLALQRLPKLQWRNLGPRCIVSIRLKAKTNSSLLKSTFAFIK